MDELKAKIAAIFAEDDPFVGIGKSSYDKADRVLALIATHAAEPAPVAVEGAPAEVWITNLLHPTRECVVLDQCEMPEPSRGDVAYIRKDLAHPSAAPTGNTALVEADPRSVRGRLQRVLNEVDDGRNGNGQTCTVAVSLLRAALASREAAAPQPTPEVEEVSVAAKVIVDAWDADTLPVCDPDPMMPAFIAALRALARGSVAEKGER